LFENVLAHVRDYHVDSIGEGDLYRKATDGLLAQLRDPYAALLLGKDLERHVERTTGDYAGIGLLVDARNGWVTVVTPMADSPAERAGLRTGDRLFEVDGQSAADWTLDRAVQAMRGKIGTPIDIAIQRDGALEPLRFRLVRERIHQRAVPAGLLLPDSVGYLSMAMVRENAADELEHEVEKLMQQGMRVLLLDLRSNPGGLRDEAVEAADLFLDPREEILVSKGRAPGDNHRWSDYRPQRWPDLPVVVLVSGGTASAAEIIAGALQDHDRAVVVGTPTFGKGLVQTLFPLGDGVALKLTTARWYTPSGRTIQRTAKNEEEQAVQAAVEAGDSVPGAPDKEHSDSAIQSRPIYHTDAGRVVRGGGGIVPDLVIRPDTLSGGEKEFDKALGSHLPEYRDVLTTYALEAKQSGSVKSEAFTVTPEMRQQVYQRLRAKGIDITPQVYEGAGGLITDQLGYEIARYVFGRPAEFRRRAHDDKQLQTAMGLLRKAGSPRELMSLATSSRAAAPVQN
jgi:carboxyl-terminal processing protease